MRRRQFPVVGGGGGYTSWVHLADAASATVLALEQKAKGVFNIVDDEPAPANDDIGDTTDVMLGRPVTTRTDSVGPELI